MPSEQERRDLLERTAKWIEAAIPRLSDHDSREEAARDADALRGLLSILAENEALRADRDRLNKVIERDRTRVADGLNAMRKAIGSREWMREPTRGSYAWDDERYQKEFGVALDEIDAALTDFRTLAADWSDCPTDPLEIAEARAALKENTHA